MLRKKILHSSMSGKNSIFRTKSPIPASKLKGSVPIKVLFKWRIYILYKHQWNTRWVFARKLDIFTCENNMLSSHVKISPLLWLHNKSRLSHQKTVKVKWFGSSLVFSIINRTLHGRLEIRNSLLVLKRNFVPLSGHLISSIYKGVL